MKKIFLSVVGLLLVCTYPTFSQSAPAAPSTEQLIEGFKLVEVASISDAMEQLYGQRNYMSHALRPLGAAKFAGIAVTVLMKREENKDGAKATKGMLDAIDNSSAGSVYIMSMENGDDFAGIGGLMATAMKTRGFAGAVIDGGVRDLSQIQKLNFPVFSRGVVPSTTVNHFRFAGMNTSVTCGGVHVTGGDIVVADMDGIVVVPRAEAEAVLKKSQDLDFAEHSTIPFIEKFRSINQAIAKFGRI